MIFPQNSLANGCVSFWNLEEASGTRVDSIPVGTSNLKTALNSLTANNTPGNATGKIGQGVSLALISSTSLSIASNSSLQLGSGVRMTITFWINFTTVLTNQALINKQNPNPDNEFRVILLLNAIGGISPGISWGVSPTSSGTSYTASVTAATFGAVTTGTWYFVVCKYNGSNISISINNGAEDTLSFSTDIFSGNATFHIGDSGLTTHNYTNAVMDAVGFWKRALKPEEITYLYRAGAGVQFPFA